MDAITMIGALAASEGANAMAILAPTELPPGHVTWTSREISAADQTFARSEQAPLLQTWLATGACLVAWKEATFAGISATDDKKPNRNKTKEIE